MYIEVTTEQAKKYREAENQQDFCEREFKLDPHDPAYKIKFLLIEEACQKLSEAA